MKKVIFICLLSLSVCLSKPSEPQVAPAAPLETHEVAPPTSTNSTPVTPKKQEETPSVHAAEIAAKNNTVPGGVTEKVNEITPKPSTESAKQEPGDEKNKASPSAAITTVTPAADTTSKPEPPMTPTPAKNASTPADHEKTSNTTTSKPDAPVKTTEAPKEGDKIVQARGFDGASFIGGIILTLGLLAIGFMGFKYYKNQTERNYHTL